MRCSRSRVGDDRRWGDRRGAAVATAAAAALAASIALASSACYRPPPPGGAPGAGGSARDAGAGAPERMPPPAEGAAAEAERLKAAGPAYTPYDNGPRLLWDDESQRALVARLAPVVESRGLSIRTRSLLWLLVTAEGRVVDAVVQTESGDAEFDRAALALAAELRFVPATVDGRGVPVWVIREISLLM